MPFGIPYFPPRQGEDIPTLGGSVPTRGGNPEVNILRNYKSVFSRFQICVSRITSPCFTNNKSMLHE